MLDIYQILGGLVGMEKQWLRYLSLLLALISSLELNAQHATDTTAAKIKMFPLPQLNLAQIGQLQNSPSFRNSKFEIKKISPVVVQKRQVDWDNYIQVNNAYSNLAYENTAKAMYSGRLHFSTKKQVYVDYRQGNLSGPSMQKSIPMHLYSWPNNRDGRVPIY